MKGKTHIVGGAAAACLVTYAIPSSEPLLMLPAGVVGGLLPDICHGGSKIGRRFRILSFLVNLLFGHRTFTHSLLFVALLAGAGFYFVPGAYTDLLIAFLAGVASHLILDAATSSGIGLLYPLDIKVRFPLTTRTGGIVEWFVFAGLSLYVVYASYDFMSFL